MAIDFEEIRDRTQEQWTRDGFQAVRVLKCDWDERHTLATELLAFGGAPYPNWPGDNVRAVEIVDMRGVGSRNSNEPGYPGFVRYEECELTVRWATVFYETWTPGAGSQTDPGIIVEESHDLATEYITVPNEFADGSYLAWSNGDDPETFETMQDEEAPGKIVRVSSYIIRRFNVPDLPDEIRTYTDKVNSEDISEITTGFIYEAETLKYAGASTVTVDNPDGTKGWNVTYRFNYRPNGWNKFWRPKTNTWEKPVKLSVNGSDLGDYDVYETADLNAVFGRL